MAPTLWEVVMNHDAPDRVARLFDGAGTHRGGELQRRAQCRYQLRTAPQTPASPAQTRTACARRQNPSNAPRVALLVSYQMRKTIQIAGTLTEEDGFWLHEARVKWFPEQCANPVRRHHKSSKPGADSQ
jgi:hypothetical protein